MRLRWVSQNFSGPGPWTGVIDSEILWYGSAGCLLNSTMIIVCRHSAYSFRRKVRVASCTAKQWEAWKDEDLLLWAVKKGFGDSMFGVSSYWSYRHWGGCWCWWSPKERQAHRFHIHITSFLHIFVILHIDFFDFSKVRGLKSLFWKPLTIYRSSPSFSAVLNRGIVNESSLAAVSTSDGSRYVFF